MPPSRSDSLGLKFDELFTNMKQTFDERSCFLAMHHGWKDGIHFQSCGHHMPRLAGKAVKVKKKINEIGLLGVL